MNVNRTKPKIVATLARKNESETNSLRRIFLQTGPLRWKKVTIVEISVYFWLFWNFSFSLSLDLTGTHSHPLLMVTSTHAQILLQVNTNTITNNHTHTLSFCRPNVHKMLFLNGNLNCLSHSFSLSLSLSLTHSLSNALSGKWTVLNG